MKPLLRLANAYAWSLFLRFVVWVLAAKQLPPAPALPPPSPELVARAARELERANLQLQLSQVDAFLGVAFGSARMAQDQTGRFFAHVERQRWRS